ncbi:TetR/AcrR family transcriptional regulator [uncultured Demequina sp.]|uniref:TetR/AcrR family transcriptional regulator n=1 Tax=uncultured Demequina sp. TaxID=693499 RepID=UPI0025FD4E45|nr:TetR family transcriptional regulator [uncultured Demequina sp.]
MALRLSPEVRRARIVETAMAIIDAEGHRGLTMAELARRCEMSTPGLMHYFPDIATLLVAVVQHRDERDRDTLEQRLGARPGEGASGESSDGAGPPARAVLDAIVDNIVERPWAAQLFAMVEADALDPAHPGHEHFRERAESLAAWLVASPGGPDDLAGARRVFAAMDGLQLHFLRDPEGFDLRAQWAAAADALLPA